MNPNCVERRESVVVLQALELTNTGMVHDLAEHFANRALATAGTDPTQQIDQIYQLALSRPPTEEEKQIALAALSELTNEWAKGKSGSEKPDPKAAAKHALTTYCHAIVNSAGFLYVD